MRALSQDGGPGHSSGLAETLCGEGKIVVTGLASPATEQDLQSRVPSSRKALSFLSGLPGTAFGCFPGQSEGARQ